jgi:hypothetical protein
MEASTKGATMAGDDEDFDADLADRGDDRPGVDEANDDDFSALGLDDDLDDDDDDYPDDAGEDEIDLVVALYREDGTPVVQSLELDLANDLDALIEALRRMPGDAGAVGMVSIDQDVFVIVRVRGPGGPVDAVGFDRRTGLADRPRRGRLPRGGRPR